MAPRHFLQPVIPDSSCGSQRGFDISALQQATLLRRVSPYARQAICLQLHAHGKWIPLPRILFLQSPHFRFNAQEFLNMMPDFVRKDICLRELSRRAESLFQLVIKSKVDIDSLVRRTIKGPRRGLRRATA